MRFHSSPLTNRLGWSGWRWVTPQQSPMASQTVAELPSHVASVARSRHLRSLWRPLAAALLLSAGSLLWPPAPLVAADYLLTIGGGFRPASNQASLEANVNFYGQVISELRITPAVHQIYFADGHDPEEDLQVASTESAPPPATELLRALYRQDDNDVFYRDHQVAQVRGASDPELIRSGLRELSQRIHRGDRMIIYVTAHGGSARGEDPYNTTIHCWGNESITVREFSEWLDRLPAEVPVVMVMAQCYCGGFGHAIFQETTTSPPRLAPQLRTGFFAQRHDLPAAGCRPDIGNDEEFSSYFWGAFVGRRRTGEPLPDCDIDGDDQISFNEAYANVLIASSTIDIPLRASDALLREFADLPTNDAPRNSRPDSGSSPRDSNFEPDSTNENRSPGENNNDRENDDGRENNNDRENGDSPAEDAPAGGDSNNRDGDRRDEGDEGRRRADGERNSDEPSARGPRRRPEDIELLRLASMSGSIHDYLVDQHVVTQKILRELTEQLNLKVDDEITTLAEAYRQQRIDRRMARRGAGRRGSSGRRDVLREVTEKWPELGDRERWHESDLLRADNQRQLLEQIQALPSYPTYAERREQRAQRDAEAQSAELREVKFRRLIHTLESVALARRLPQTASPEVVQRYQAMIELENSPFQPSSVPTLSPDLRGR